MHVIVVYDVGVKRVQKVHKYLKTVLHWVQNSVFEGEITVSEKVKLKGKLKKLINKKEDSVIIFDVGHVKSIKREIIGKEKNELENIL